MPLLENGEEKAVRAEMQQGLAEGMPDATGEHKDTSRTPTPTSSRPQSPRPSSPVPKVIGRGRGGRFSPVQSPAKQGGSPTSAAVTSAMPDGNPPTGIVKGRRASLEGAQGGAAGRGRPQEPAPRGSGGSTVSLGDGWEEDVDPRTGRTFFVNHKIKKWSWNPPMLPGATKAKEPPTPNRQKDSAPEGEQNELARPMSSSTVQSSSALSRTNSGQSLEDAVSDAIKVVGENEAPAQSHATTEAGGRGEKVEERQDEVQNMSDKGMQSKQPIHKTTPIPPLNMPVVHTPVKRDDRTQTPVDAKWRRFEHDREVDELKTEIHLIRSQSKDRRKRSYLDPWSSGALDSKTDGASTPLSDMSSAKVKGSLLTHIDISKIRQVCEKCSQHLPGQKTSCKTVSDSSCM